MRWVLALLCVAALLSACSDDSKDTTATATPVKTASGLQYTDLKVGTGEPVKAGQTAVMQYTGWLQGPDGKPSTKFDSSRDRNQPFPFRLGAGQVIKGWDEGVAGMRKGGQRRLVIPPDLAYGARGAGDGVPPNSTLIFDVELEDIK